MDIFRSKNAYTGMIEKATDESLLAEDLSLNLAVVEAVQVDHNGPKDALRALRKRLFKSTEPKVQLLSLSLLDMLVKNCGSPLYNLVADKDFLGDLGKLIRDRKTNGTVRDKALDLLQCWRAGLLHEPAGKHIEETNIKLKRDGIEFPSRDLSAVPPIKRDAPRQPPPAPRGFLSEMSDAFFGDEGTPGAVLGPPPASTGYVQHAYAQPGVVYGAAPVYLAPHGVPTTVVPPHAALAVVTPAQRDEQIRRESVAMKETLALFAEALVYADPSTENVKENPLITEFYQRCEMMQPQLVQFISEATNEQLVSDLITLNEQVVNRFEMYHAYAAQYARAHGGSEPPRQTSPTMPSSAVSPGPRVADAAPQSAAAAPAMPQSDFDQLESIFGAGAPMSQAALEADMLAMGFLPSGSSPAPAAASNVGVASSSAAAPADEFEAFFEQRLHTSSPPTTQSSPPLPQSSPLPLQSPPPPTATSSDPQPPTKPPQGSDSNDFSFF